MPASGRRGRTEKQGSRWIRWVIPRRRAPDAGPTRASGCWEWRRCRRSRPRSPLGVDGDAVGPARRPTRGGRWGAVLAMSNATAGPRTTRRPQAWPVRGHDHAVGELDVLGDPSDDPSGARRSIQPGSGLRRGEVEVGADDVDVTARVNDDLIGPWSRSVVAGRRLAQDDRLAVVTRRPMGDSSIDQPMEAGPSDHHPRRDRRGRQPRPRPRPSARNTAAVVPAADSTIAKPVTRLRAAAVTRCRW